MKMECPLPNLDFDVITLGHGSGGLLSHRLLRKCIFELLHNEYLDEEDDGAIIEVGNLIAVSTDSFVVTPIFFPGGNIGDLAVHGTINDIAMCGAIPKFISLGLILEEGLEVKDLWEVLISVRNACNNSGVKIITGDTKVVEKGSGDKIFINTTGIGQIHPNANLGIEKIKIGDKIIVSGNIASHGLTILAERQKLGFKHDLESDTQPLNHIIHGLLNQFGSHIKFLRDPTRGGLAAVLNEIVDNKSYGVLLEESEIPILEQVKSLSEILGIDPLNVANEGIFISVIQPDIEEEYLALLRGELGCVNAQTIGSIKDDFHAQVVLLSRIGGQRLVQMPLGEQLPRIC